MVREGQEACATIGIVTLQNLQHSSHAGQLVIEQTVRLSIPKSLSQEETANAPVEPFFIRVEEEWKAIFITTDGHHDVIVESFHLRRIGRKLKCPFRLQNGETAQFFNAKRIFLNIDHHGLTSNRFYLVASVKRASCSISSA